MFLFHQLRDNFPIRRWERVPRQVARRNPFPRGAADGARSTANPATVKRVHCDLEMRVRVIYRREFLSNCDFDPQLLVHFARDALFERFVSFAVATGEFPQTTE